MRALAAIVLIVASAFAGCVGGDGGLTAKEAASRGLERARQWHPDAALVGLAGFEVRNATLLDGGPFGFPLVAAAGALDGRAPGWFLGYVSPGAGGSLGLAVFANGTILATEDEDAGEARPVRAWEVDSPRVFEVLAGHPEVAPLLAAPDASAGLFLVTPESNLSDPLWNFFLHAGTAGKAAQGAVGARAGDVIAVLVQNLTGTGAFQGDFPGPRTYSFDGTVDPRQPEAVHAFDVLAGHTGLTLTFSAQGRLPTDGADYAILDPAGAEVAAERSPGAGFGFTFSTSSYQLGEPGTYSLVVRYLSEVPEVPVPSAQQTAYGAELYVA